MLQKLKKIDYVVVTVLVMLMIISITSLYSATKDTKWDGYHVNMLIFYIVGFLAFFGMSLLDYRLLMKNALYIYLGGLALLVFVMFFGAEINGSKGWINLGFTSLQPAEMFKLVLIIFLTFVLIRKNKPQLSFIRDVIPVGLVAFIPFVLVMAINDLGNALSYVIILFGLLWIGNIKLTHALIGILLMAGTAFGGIQAYIHYHDEITAFMKEGSRSHWMARIDPWLMPENTDPAGAGYHTHNAKLAIASGGMSGEGYMQGSSVQSGRVPYTYSDSIFVQIAEEFGFIGSSVLLLLYFILIHRMILISLESKERAGPFLIVGIVSMLLYQIFENIGMFIGLMPLTGITLPFISYGGTSLVISMASLGVAMSVKLHGQEIDEDLPEPNTYRSTAKPKQA